MLYCFAIGIVNGSAFQPGSALIHENSSGKENYFSVASISLFCQTSQPKPPLTSFKNSPPPTLNDSAGEYAAMAKASSQLRHSAFAQYISFSKNFPIRFRKANLIFPFHYFW